jgi:hypothetical protein
MIDLNGLGGYRDGVNLDSWPHAGYCGGAPSAMATRLISLWTITT